MVMLLSQFHLAASLEQLIVVACSVLVTRKGEFRKQITDLRMEVENETYLVPSPCLLRRDYK